jgi:23S rRNA (pseudouridine1915-N3)-methyltransferase
VKITVLAVGRIRPPYSDDIQHYQKLLARYCRLELIEVREDEDVVRRIPGKDWSGGTRPPFVVLLDREGEELSSEAFSVFLEQRRQAARDLVFVVGGPYGTDLAMADHKLSFGPMTLPHQLARVVLLEQLYRGHKILAREPYHH